MHEHLEDMSQGAEEWALHLIDDNCWLDPRSSDCLAKFANHAGPERANCGLKHEHLKMFDGSDIVLAALAVEKPEKTGILTEITYTYGHADGAEWNSEKKQQG